MPEFNKKYATNSYNLLKDAYGDELKTSLDDFLIKSENDVQGTYRNNIYNLLADKYGGDIIRKLSADEFNNKFFVDKFDQELKAKDLEIEKAQEQVSFGEADEEQELAPEEYFEEQRGGTGLYRKAREKSITKNYWEEKLETLTQEKERIGKQQITAKTVDDLDDNQLKEVQSGENTDLLKKGYSPDVVNYVKKEEQFNKRKEQINKDIKESGSAHHLGSLYNYEKEKGNLSDYNPNVNKLLKDSDFMKLNKYEDRIEFLEKEAENYVATYEGTASDDEVRRDFYADISPYILFDDKGNPSIYALQNMSKILSDEIGGDLNALEIKVQQLEDEKSKDLKGKFVLATPGSSVGSTLAGRHHKNNDKISSLNREISNLKRTDEILNNSLRQPLSGGSFGQGVANTDWMDQATVGVKSIIETVDYLRINKKYAKGEELTKSEQDIVDAVGILTYIENGGKKDIMYNIGEGVAQMPAYMAGFAIGSPLYAGTKGAIQRGFLGGAKKAAEKLAAKTLKKTALGKLSEWTVQKGLPGVIGAIPQTVVNPSTSILENTARRMTDITELAFSPEMTEASSGFVEGTGAELKEALGKGAVEAYTETLFEHSGTALMGMFKSLGKGATKWIPKGVKKIAPKKAQQTFKNILYGDYARLKNIKKGTATFSKLVKKGSTAVGFNGVIEEMMEEYATNIANAIAIGEDPGLDLETFLTTMGTVAIWGGGMSAIQRTAAGVDKTRGIEYRLPSVSGKKGTKVRIPYKLYKDLENLKTDGNISSVQINEVLDKYPKLSKDQVKVVLGVWQKSRFDEMVKNVKEEEGKEKEEKKIPFKTSLSKKDQKKGEEQVQKEISLLEQVIEKHKDDKEEEDKTTLKLTKERLELLKNDPVQYYKGEVKDSEDNLKYWEGQKEDKAIEIAKTRLAEDKEKLKLAEDLYGKKEKEKKKKPVSDTGEANEFDEYDELVEFRKGDLSEDIEKQTEESIEKIEKDIVKKYHDPEALTDETVRVNQLEEGAEITVQKNIGKIKVNAPAEVIGVGEGFVRIKYKNGIEDILSPETKDRLFINQKEEIDEDGKIKKFKSKQNEGKKQFNETKLSTGEFVYSKPIKIEGAEEGYSIFRNDDGTYDIINEKGEIQDITGPKTKVQSEIKKRFENQLENQKELEKIKDKKEEKKPKKRGRFIYARAGTGKSRLAKEQPEKYTDADVLIAEEIQKEVDNFVLDDAMKEKIRNLDPNNLGDDFGPFILNLYKAEKAKGIGWQNATMEKVYKAVGKRINQELEAGKDVLTGSPRFAGKVDKAFTQAFDVVEKRKGRKLRGLEKKEKEELAKAKITPIEIKEEKYLADVIEEEAPPKKPEVKKPIKPEDTIDDKIKKLQDRIDYHKRFIADTDSSRAQEASEKQINAAEKEINKLKEQKKKPKPIEKKEEPEIEVPDKELDKLKNFFDDIQLKVDQKKKDSRGNLQSGLPFVSWDTASILIKGIRKFLDTAISFRNLIDNVKRWMSTLPGYTQEEIDKMLRETEAYFETTHESVQKLRDYFSSKGINYESPESIAATIEEKVNAHRKVFSSIFKNVAEETGIDKKILEKTFFNSVRQGLFDKLETEADYKKALEKAKKDNPNYEKLYDEVLKNWSYPKAVSLFNFYRSVRLIEQHGMILTKDGIKIKSLNSEDFTHNFAKTFENHIRRITYGDFKSKIEDNPNVAITNHREDLKTRIKNINNKSNSESKLEIFEAHLDFLYKITGIEKDSWRQYFSPITTETEVYLQKIDEEGNETYEKVVFKDYDSLLKYNPNMLVDGKYEKAGILSGQKIKGKYSNNNVYFLYEGKYRKKIAPAIINSLTSTIDFTADITKVRQKVTDFFTKESKEHNTYSNLKKLASAVSSTGDVAIDGLDVEGSRFNSFQLMSHLQNAVENVHKSLLDNAVANMYKNAGVPMKLLMINGIANNNNNKSSKSDRMTENEYWLTQLVLFSQAEEGKYKGFLGQFGDKKQIYASDVVHYKKADLKELEKEFHNIDEVRDMLSSAFNAGLKLGMFKEQKRTSKKDFIDGFIYNFAKNTKDLLEIIHGDLTDINYKDLTELVKRAGSTNSTGYRPDPNVKGGVGKTWSFVSALDLVDPNFYDELGLSKEQFDGALFYSGIMGEKMAISMGELYSKADEFEGPLSSIKALFSTQKNKKRGLTKTNWYNIDVIAEAYKDNPNHYSHKIKALLETHKIDAISFDSGTKKLEKKSHLTLFDKDGNIRDISREEMSNHAFDRNTSDIYIQQDLRHKTDLDMDKQSTQLMANILPLGHAAEMVKEMNNQIKATLKDLTKKLSAIDSTQDKIDFLKEKLETQDQEELQELVEKGVTLYDLGYTGMMQSMIASHLEKKGLRKLANRVSTQELPADHTLKGLRKTKDGKHTLLPQVDVGIEGLRYEQKFESQEKALDHYDKNKEDYEDLERWEIEDGVIPGDYVLSTRVPADDLHSHTLARARTKLNGNFVALDKESQARSGSDYDGDQRFIQALFRDKNDKIIKGGVKANANRFLEALKKDYTNPDNFDRILHPIDTNFFDPIIDSDKISYMFGDPQGLNDARKKNLMGVTMKGILSDLSTMAAVIANHNIGTKSIIQATPGLSTTKEFAKDPDGSLRNVLGILLNLAFDNAKDPKLEAMGLNEVTANMFVLLLIGDSNLDKIADIEKKEDRDDAYRAKVKSISDFMNSPLVEDFTKRKREANGALSNKTDRDVFNDMHSEYGTLTSKGDKFSKRVFEFSKLYYAAGELMELKKYYGLTKSLPNNTAELLSVMNTVDDFTNNKTSFLDVSGLADSKIKTFEQVEETVRFATNRVFNHTVELSEPGMKIFKQIVERKAKKIGAKKMTLSQKEIKSIINSLNLIVAVDALNKRIEWTDKPQTLDELEKSIWEALPQQKEIYEGNKFLNALQRRFDANISKQENFDISIDDNLKYTKLPEADLKEIRNDFDKLPTEYKKSLALYALQKYGLKLGTFSGNFFNLFSLDFRVELSKMIENEAEKWQQGWIGNSKINSTIDWIIKMDSVMKESLGIEKKKSYESKYDINTDPMYELTNETLKAVAAVSNLDDFNTVVKKYNINEKAFKADFTYARTKAGELTVREYAKNLLEQREDFSKFEKEVDLYNLAQKFKPCKL